MEEPSDGLRKKQKQGRSYVRRWKSFKFGNKQTVLSCIDDDDDDDNNNNNNNNNIKIMNQIVLILLSCLVYLFIFKSGTCTQAPMLWMA